MNRSVMDKYSLYDKFDRGIGSIILSVLIAGARTLLRPDKSPLRSVLTFFGSIGLSVGVGFILHQSGGWISQYDYVGVAITAYAGKEITTSFPQKIPNMLLTLLMAFVPKLNQKKDSEIKTEEKNDENLNNGSPSA